MVRAGTTTNLRTMSAEEVPGGPTGLAEEWSARGLDFVDQGLDVLHDRVLRPAILVGRSVVFGVIGFVVGLVVLILVVVALVRVLDVYVFGGRVWASYLLLGTILCLGGFFAWTRRTAPSSDGD
jgi:hypothetical protein